MINGWGRDLEGAEAEGVLCEALEAVDGELQALPIYNYYKFIINNNIIIIIGYNNKRERGA